MTTLVNASPDHHWQTRNPDAPKMHLWYYGTTASAPQTVGTEYGVVYSPNPYAQPDSEWRGWRYVVFEVVRTKGRSGKSTIMQAEKRKRLLTSEEVAYFEWLKGEYTS